MSGTVAIRRIAPHEWTLFRQVRLAALADSPAAFAKPLARAEALGDQDWQRLAREGAAGEVSCCILALAFYRQHGYAPLADGPPDHPAVAACGLVFAKSLQAA